VEIYSHFPKSLLDVMIRKAAETTFILGTAYGTARMELPAFQWDRT
jgi:hypothetical protein